MRDITGYSSYYGSGIDLGLQAPRFAAHMDASAGLLALCGYMSNPQQKRQEGMNKSFVGARTRLRYLSLAGALPVQRPGLIPTLTHE